MKKALASPLRWQVAAVGAQVALVAACGAAGWQLLHPATPGGALTIRRAVNAPTVAPVTLPSLLPRPSAHTSVPVARPGLEDLITRVNRDDSRLYRGQWATLELVASATRDYLTHHVLPLLLAAARGGAR